MIIGNKTYLNEGKTYIMGILNVTPDSFSDGGCYNNIDNALKQAEILIQDGADIIDIGGESTRPGFTPVGMNEELKRILPVITEIKKRFDTTISVDTFHSDVAYEAVNAGADLINDIWGLRYDDNEVSMAQVVKKTGASVCIMHNSYDTINACGNNSEDVQNGIKAIINELNESIQIAKDYGIDDNKIMIDPGVGFAKDYHMNMAVIANLDIFSNLGYPVLLGASRKSVIGNTLDLPVDERLEGTIATSVLAVAKKCSFIRVHDVKSNIRAIKMMEELQKYEV